MVVMEKLQSGSCWVGFKYEKLHTFCFHCGVIRHGQYGYSQGSGQKRSANACSTPYGHWLRVSFPYRWGMRGMFRPEMKVTGISRDGAQSSGDSSKASGEESAASPRAATPRAEIPSVASGGVDKKSMPLRSKEPSLETLPKPLLSYNNVEDSFVKKRKVTQKSSSFNSRAGGAVRKKVWRECGRNGKHLNEGENQSALSETGGTIYSNHGRSTWQKF
jgi:hypothetical protein